MWGLLGRGDIRGWNGNGKNTIKSELKKEKQILSGKKILIFRLIKQGSLK